MEAMRLTVITLVQKTSSNAKSQADAFLVLGNAMGTLTVWTVLMNPTRSVTTGSATRKQNSPAAMESVFLSCGSVTMTMTAGMTVTSRLTAAGTEIVQRAGEDVQVIQTIDVSLNGSSAMERMTAEMEQMNCQKTVQNAKKRETSNVETKDVYQKDGCVILKMIVEIILMRMMKCAREDIENARSQSSDVETINVYQLDGDVITMMIVATAVTRRTA